MDLVAMQRPEVVGNYFLLENLATVSLVTVDSLGKGVYTAYVNMLS
jgi:hypothetical protein